jgi:hypothetical protein
MTTIWSAPTSNDAAARRAGGRRRFNAERQLAASYRREEVYTVLWREGKLHERGIRVRLAERLGVSYGTICTDVKKLLEEMAPCPTCGSPARLRHKC